jgi:hypothetical protein
MRSQLATLIAAVVAAGLAACGSGASPGASASPSPTGWTDAQILAVAREYAQCVRANGLPQFTDPTVVDGRLNVVGPDGEQAREAYQACASIIGRLPSSAFGKDQQRSVSNEDLATLRRFAKCVRAHGAPWFPDPQSDGTFLQQGTPLEDHEVVPGFDDAMNACRQFEGPGITILSGR